MTPLKAVAGGRAVSESADNYRITVKPGWKFTDGSPVTALIRRRVELRSLSAMLNCSGTFSPIEGYGDVAGAPGDKAGPPCPELRAVNDLEFTVRLKAPMRCALATARLSAAGLRISGHGRVRPNPIGNGPYKPRRRLAGRHRNTKIKIRAWCPTPTTTATSPIVKVLRFPSPTPIWTPPMPTCCPACLDV